MSRRASYFGITALVILMLTLLVVFTLRRLQQQMGLSVGSADGDRAELLARTGTDEAIALAFGVRVFSYDGDFYDAAAAGAWSHEERSALALRPGESLRYTFRLATDARDLDGDGETRRVLFYDPWMRLDGMDNAEALFGGSDGVIDNESPVRVDCALCPRRGYPIYTVEIRASAAGAVRHRTAWISLDPLDLAMLPHEWAILPGPGDTQQVVPLSTGRDDRVAAALSTTAPFQSQRLFVDGVQHHPDLDLAWGLYPGEIDPDSQGRRRRLHNWTTDAEVDPRDAAQADRRAWLVSSRREPPWSALDRIDFAAVGFCPIGSMSATALNQSTRIADQTELGMDPFYSAGEFGGARIGLAGPMALRFARATGFETEDPLTGEVRRDARGLERLLAGADVQREDWPVASPSGLVFLDYSEGGGPLVLHPEHSQTERPSLLYVRGDVVIDGSWQWKGWVYVEGTLRVSGGRPAILGALAIEAPANATLALDGLRVLASRPVLADLSELEGLPVLLGSWDTESIGAF